MSTIANWYGHTFEVSPQLIRSFSGLSIKSGCETTEKNSANQKYQERKYGNSPEVEFTIHLSALTGVTDVYAEAMQYIQEATDGACSYFYIGDQKLIQAQLILVSAEVSEIVTMPGNGGKWISADVKVKFQQGTLTDGLAVAEPAGDGGGGWYDEPSGGGGGGTKKKNIPSVTIVDIQTADDAAKAGKEASKGLLGRLADIAIGGANTVVTAAKNAINTAQKQNASTGRANPPAGNAKATVNKAVGK
ncbi:MAG: hypothetical protein IJ188_06365 [Clostridia bacterium]|nr:hypothetical protein [Clostridia bacterium]